MHEWALAESVVKAVSENAAAEKLKSVAETEVFLGELQAIDKEIFSFALSEIKPQYALMKNCIFKIIDEKCILKCKVCNKQFDLKKLKERTHTESENIHFVPEMAGSFMNCPYCKSPDFEIIQGRGVTVGNITGEK